MPVIEARGVGHAYGDRTVLRDLDVTLTEQRVGIVGANGSGKSTFARMVNGLVLPTRGRVSVDGLPQQVLLVTHHLDLLDGFDRVLVFDDGALVCDDEPTVAVAFYRKSMA